MTHEVAPAVFVIHEVARGQRSDELNYRTEFVTPCWSKVSAWGATTQKGSPIMVWSESVPSDGQLFRNGIREGLPTIRPESPDALRGWTAKSGLQHCLRVGRNTSAGGWRKRMF